MSEANQAAVLRALYERCRDLEKRCLELERLLWSAEHARDHLKAGNDRLRLRLDRLVEIMSNHSESAEEVLGRIQAFFEPILQLQALIQVSVLISQGKLDSMLEDPDFPEIDILAYGDEEEDTEREEEDRV